MFQSFTAAAVRTDVKAHNYTAARQTLRELVKTGIVGYEPADKGNPTAQILVDGERVGQASTLLVGLSYAEHKLVKGYIKTTPTFGR